MHVSLWKKKRKRQKQTGESEETRVQSHFLSSPLQSSREDTQEGQQSSIIYLHVKAEVV